MPSSTDPETLLDTITTLALEIGQRCPDCADQAGRIATLAREIRAAPLDRGAIQDVLEAETSEADLSDVHVRTTTEAVIRAAKRDT